MVVVYLDALLEVGALELAGEAGDGRAVGLVLLVEAVVVAVAHPRRGDAVPRARTRELLTLHTTNRVIIFIALMSLYRSFKLKDLNMSYISVNIKSTRQ